MRKPKKKNNITSHLLLIGGGNPHLHFINKLIMNNNLNPHTQVTLITPSSFSLYSAMIPGVVTGKYTMDDCRIDLASLCQKAGVSLILGVCNGIDTESRLVFLEGSRPPIYYDILSLNVGGEQDIPWVKEKFDSAVCVGIKPLDKFLEVVDNLKQKYVSHLKEKRTGSFNVGVVGGGCAGIEIASSLQELLDQIDSLPDVNLLDKLHTDFFPPHNIECDRERKLHITTGNNDNRTSHKVTLLTKGSQLLSKHPSAAADLATKELILKGVDIHLNKKVSNVHESNNGVITVTIEHQLDTQEFDFVFFATPVSPPSFLKTAGVKVDDEGFVCVWPSLRSMSHPTIFASGDVAVIEGHPRPRAGVFAVRAGATLSWNLERITSREPENRMVWLPFLSCALGVVLLKRPRIFTIYLILSVYLKYGSYNLKRLLYRIIPASLLQKLHLNYPEICYEPQTKFLSILSIGRSSAIAIQSQPNTPPKLLHYGASAALWKEKIDRKWKSMYLSDFQKHPLKDVFDLKMGQTPTLINTLETASKLFAENKTMLCGGCGSKVGPTVLKDVMSSFPNEYWGDDCSLVSIGEESTTQTVDYLKSFTDDAYEFGRISANHAFSDCYACGSSPSLCMIMVVIPDSLQSSELKKETLRQLMGGVIEEAKKQGCRVVGGHSAVGAELAVGISVTGILNPGRSFLMKTIPNSDLSLILTKPLGIGVILAAHAAADAYPLWVDGCREAMLQSNGDAMQSVGHLVKACTDVTGFGLLGHLNEMLIHSNSEIKVKLRLSQIPFLKGASECVGRGHLSSLFPENLSQGESFELEDDRVFQVQDARKKMCLLIDPQTSGGLLLAVDQKDKDICIDLLRDRGFLGCSEIGYTILAKKNKIIF